MKTSRNKVTILNIASTIVLQGLAFFTGPIFSAMLGTSNYGIASVYLTWVQLASTVFTLQAGGTVAIAKVNFPEEEQAKYQSSVLSLSSISYLCFSVLTVIGSLIMSNWFSISISMILVGLLHGWGLYVVSFMNLKYTYELKAGRNSILSVLVSALSIALSIFLIYKMSPDVNYWGRLIGQSAVYTVIGVILFSNILKAGKVIVDKNYWKFTLPIAIPTIFHLLAGLVLNQSDRVMIQGLIDNSAAGIYALACTFGTVLHSIWSALNNSWVPYYYEYTKNKQIDEIRKHANNYIELYTVIAMGFILLSKEVFHFYAKPAFWEGTDLIPIFSIGFYFIFLYSLPVNFEFYHKKTKTIAVGTTLAAVCNIILNYFFILKFGIWGAVIATAIAHGLQFGFHYICAKRINPEEFPFKILQFVPGFIAVCLTCVVYWFTRELWFVRWGLGALLGAYLLIKIIKRREIF
ncbi:MAG: oligosaccharide flippase family protein [Eubacteriales bacterium]|nr:oligosaccharide flippase family protein [Eubacteriales bacterium]